MDNFNDQVETDNSKEIKEEVDSTRTLEKLKQLHLKTKVNLVKRICF